MDLQLYFRVLWRFKWLVAVGMLLAVALAILSFMAPNFSGKGPLLEYRQGEQWVSYSTIFVTQEGFPWGQLTDATAQKQGSALEKAADPNRFSTLAVLYAHLATSDQVRALILRDGPMYGEVDAAPLYASESNQSGPLPLVRIAAIADSSEHSLQLVVRMTEAFKTFLAEEQEANKIPDGNRVRLTVLKKADKPQLWAGRSLTLPMVVFIAVMILVSGLAFILENMRPRVRPRPVAAAADQAPAGDARLSA
ncbi:MAG TPA: hypothetical protein VGQ84_09330 [Gaiellaceae bacterium]|jgi:hypothetical protein|nr:hypothetical protein [Gaiellaceae bacterium]